MRTDDMRPDTPKPCFFYGAGNPVDGGQGMDIVLRDHLAELASAVPPVAARVVSPRPVAAGNADPSRQPAQTMMWPADLSKPESTWRRQWRRLKHVLSGRPLMTFGLSCEAARNQFRRDIRSPNAVFIIDHFQTIANISLPRLLFSRAKTIYICHDYTPKTVVDSLPTTRSILKKAWLLGQYLQVLLVESWLIRRSSHTFFLSNADRLRYRWIGAHKSSTLSPAMLYRTVQAGEPGDARQSDELGDVSRSVVFIGSPNFPPNRFAIEWIVDRLAPELNALGSPIELILVGKGTQDYAGRGRRNVRALGFVPDAQLDLLMKRCMCSISPVVHGSGLKIKLLEAFAAGCAVMATRESLSGFDFMGELPLIEIDNPAAAAADLTALSRDAGRVAELRSSIASSWRAHQNWRRRRLSDFVEAMVSSRTAAPEATLEPASSRR